MSFYRQLYNSSEVLKDLHFLGMSTELTICQEKKTEKELKKLKMLFGDK
jgi:hypothetical protein